MPISVITSTTIVLIWFKGLKTLIMIIMFGINITNACIGDQDRAICLCPWKEVSPMTAFWIRIEQYAQNTWRAAFGWKASVIKINYLSSEMASRLAMLAVLDMTSVAIHNLQKWPPKLQVPEMSLIRANGMTTVATKRSENNCQCQISCKKTQDEKVTLIFSC